MTTATIEQETPTRVDRSGCLGGPRHGDVLAYNKDRCRCPDARQATTRYRMNLKLAHIASGHVTVKTRPSLRRVHRQAVLDAGMVDATPTAVRLRVLAAIGWSWPALARCLGWGNPGEVADLARRSRDGVWPHVAGNVRDLYVDLVRRPAPYGTAAEQALDDAATAGWGVVDVVAVFRALDGAAEPDRRLRVLGVPLTRLEKQAVIYTGVALGHEVTTITRAARCSGTVAKAALTA